MRVFSPPLDLVWALEQVAHLPAESVRTADVSSESDPAWRSHGRPWIIAPAFRRLGRGGAGGCARKRRREAGGRRLTQFTWALPEGMSSIRHRWSRPTASTSRSSEETRRRAGSSSTISLRASAVAIPGTEGAQAAILVTRQKAFGFFARGQLMKVALARWCTCCQLPTPVTARGGAWNPRGHRVCARYRPGRTLSVSDGGAARARNAARRLRGDNVPQVAGIPPRWGSLPLLRALHE